MSLKLDFFSGICRLFLKSLFFLSVIVLLPAHGMGMFSCLVYSLPEETRPATRQNIRGRMGRGSNTKTASNQKIFQTDGRTNGPTDTARCRVACPRLKRILFFFFVLASKPNHFFLLSHQVFNDSKSPATALY